MTKQSQSILKVIVFTLLALTAFAANSVLCRLALGKNTIDASSFTVVRLITGALTLWVILSFQTKNRNDSSKGSWIATVMLLVYAVTFSFSYITLDTGTGALILFGSVQITMILLSLFSGNKLHMSEWAGVLISFSGLVYLVLPGVSTPSVTGFILMAVAGMAWGGYTLKGRGSASPLRDTAYNFFRSVPFTLLLALITLLNFNSIQISSTGIVLAALSGGLTSGIGYTIWYIALGGLSDTQAAVVQLSVPMIAAFGGVVFVSEKIGLRLTLSTLLILGGILTVILGRYYFVFKKQKSLVISPSQAAGEWGEAPDTTS